MIDVERNRRKEHEQKDYNRESPKTKTKTKKMALAGESGNFVLRKGSNPGPLAPKARIIPLDQFPATNERV